MNKFSTYKLIINAESLKFLQWKSLGIVILYYKHKMSFTAITGIWFIFFQTSEVELRIEISEDNIAFVFLKFKWWNSKSTAQRSQDIKYWCWVLILNKYSDHIIKKVFHKNAPDC